MAELSKDDVLTLSDCAFGGPLPYQNICGVPDGLIFLPPTRRKLLEISHNPKSRVFIS